MKAVFHINEAGKWATTFNSCFNARKVALERGQTPELYIVANGEAVTILTAGEGPLAEQRRRIFEALEQGVHVCFCKKAMNLRTLEMPEDLKEAEVVASSAITIIDLQQQGYAYIKS